MVRSWQRKPESSSQNPANTLTVIFSNKSNSMGNNSAAKSVLNWKMGPALITEYLLETFAGFAVDEKTDQQHGSPEVSANRFGCK
jgi:hypothetical protein